MPDIWTLRLKDGKSYLQLLNEWEDKFKTPVQWENVKKPEDNYQYHSTPTRKYKTIGRISNLTHSFHGVVNGQYMKDCTGVALSIQEAKNKAAKLLSDNKRLVSLYSCTFTTTTNTDDSICLALLRCTLKRSCRRSFRQDMGYSITLTGLSHGRTVIAL